MQGRVCRLLPRQVQHEALQQLQQSQGDLSVGLACPSPAGGTWAPPSPPPWTDLWPHPHPRNEHAQRALEALKEACTKASWAQLLPAAPCHCSTEGGGGEGGIR